MTNLEFNKKELKENLKKLRGAVVLSTILVLAPPTYVFASGDYMSIARTGGHSHSSSSGSKSSSSSSKSSSSGSSSTSTSSGTKTNGSTTSNNHTYGSTTDSSSTVNHSTRDSLGNTSAFNSNSNAYNAATRADYYHTSSNLFTNILLLHLIFSNHHSYAASNNTEENTQVPTEEEFEASVERLSQEADYLNGVTEEDLSEEEMAAITKDCNIIMAYMDANKEKDYSTIYHELLNERVKEDLEKKGIDNFTVGAVEVLKEEKKKYVSIDMTINGEEMKIIGGGYLVDVFEDMGNHTPEQFEKNVKNLTNNKFSIDLETKTINNFSLEDNNALLLAIGGVIGLASLGGVAAAVAMSKALRESEEKPKVKLKK